MSHQRFSVASVFLAFVLLSHSRLGTAYVTVGYSPQKTDFSLSFRDETSSQKITPLFALPGETLSLQFSSDDPNAVFTLSELVNADATKPALSNDHLRRDTPSTWSLTVPEKVGTYLARVQNVTTGNTMDLRVFVMVPFSQNKGAINGYKIGQYPRIPSTKLTQYSLPRGFVEVTNENKDLLLTPHFKLSQFLCKQQSGTFPQYVVLRERLLFKLEYVLEHVNTEGIPAQTFSVMSGYRTPYYNKALGNVKLSRHMWGDAADIYINNDPRAIGMQDLNADGKSDMKDAQLLSGLVDQLNAEPSFKQFVGGLGSYKPTSAHGPFVHIDARGFSANWSSN